MSTNPAVSVPDPTPASGQLDQYPIKYFAYGSNMGRAQMQQRCPDHVWLGPATLQGYCWMIAADGYASVRLSQPDRVEGVLFSLSEADVKALDHCEEIHLGVYHKLMMPVSIAGQECMALVYVNTAGGTGSASPEYSNRLLQAFVDATLSDDYVNRYLKSYLPDNQS